MKNSRLFKRVVKSGGARALAMLAAILLVMEPYAFALNQLVSKYPTGSPTIGSVDMDPGAGVNTLYYGSVFGFNSAKDMTQTTNYAEISEGACVPEGTSYPFISGMDGWNGLKTNPQFPGGADSGTRESYMYDSTSLFGQGTPPTAIKTVFTRSNSTEKFTWERKFFYDCGEPSAVTFQLKYSQGVWNFPHATNPKNFRVDLYKPSDIAYATPIPLVAQTNITAASMTSTPASPASIATSSLNEVGTYTIRITGNLSTTTGSGVKLEVAFDDINLAITPQAAYTSFKQDVEVTCSDVPLSTTNSYTLEIRAKKASAGAENVDVWVYDGTSPDTGQGAGWVYKTTINNTTHTDTTWTPLTKEYYNPDYSLPLSVAEFNNGDVRVRYIDASPTGDGAQDTFSLDYQRVKVDQGQCVDSVTNSASDCGKCHNFGDDVTKPWPSLGMHYRHAQTESISDCLWCHPSSTYTSNHRDGVLQIDGTKVFKLATTPTSNPSLTNQTYDPATKQCSNIECHKGLPTPAWDSVEGVGGYYRNCSRCHNSTGTKAPDALGNLNVDSAWPNDAGQGHLKHDAAFNLTQASCQDSGSCHPNNTTQHSVVGDSKVEVKMSSVYASPNKIPKYIPDTVNGTGTCVNMACHGGQQTPRFNLANTPAGPGPIDIDADFTNTTDISCKKCHIAEKADGWGTGAGMASQWNSAISGLHRGSPLTSQKSHIADYGCTKCHNNPANHFMTAGASNLTDTDLDTLTGTDFKASVGVVVGSGGTRPNWTTPTSCSVAAFSSGGVLASACHAESDTFFRNPASPWARKWSWDAYDTVTPANQCKNCHGTWGNFASGVSTPHAAKGSAGGVLQLNHSDSGLNCGTMCHGQTDTTNYKHGVALELIDPMPATSKSIDINSNAGWVDNNGASQAANTTVGCGACHASNDSTNPLNAGTHVFQETGWTHTTPAPVGPAPNCLATSCHGASAGSNVGLTTSASGNFSAARHHLTGTPTKEQCAVCHNTTNQKMSVADATSAGTRDKIYLRNADTGAEIIIDQSLADTNATRNTNFVTFCTSCHDANGATNSAIGGAGNALAPFQESPTPGVPKDIADKYNSTITAKTHNYTFNTTPQLTKARSPHGKPGTNDMKQATEQSTYTDANPVGCQSCHPSHGGTALNPLPAISGGADLTTIGGRMMKAGYSEPGSCWTCHNSAGVKDYYGDVVGGGANWVGTQNSAFTYKQRNYWSRHQVQATAFSTTSAQARTTQDTTANISCSICHDPHGAASWNGTSGSVSYYAFSLRGTWMTSPYLEDRAGQRNGTQTSALYTNTGGAPNNVMSGAGPREESTAAYTKPSVYGNGYDAASGGSGHNGYYIDENTFGSTGSTYGTFNSGTGRTGVVPTYMGETDTQFAGLCANCHAATVSASSGGTLANMQTYLEANGATDWAGGKIHQTVKGWAVPADVTDKVNNNATDQYYRMHVIASTNGAAVRGIRSVGSYSPRNAFNWGVAANEATSKQKYHEFSCSKCHTPHASSLGRLMITNCLDVGTGTTSRAAKTAANNPGGTQRYAFTYPTISTGAWTGGTGPNTSGSQAAMHCHNQKKTNISAGGGWNKVTGW